jgi:hypothetical protein
MIDQNKHRVIDTNVLIVANNRESEHASLQCVISCQKYLQSFRESKILVIDNKWEILKEYLKYYKKAHNTGQPRVGDEFLEWVLSNQNNPKHCQKAPITKICENEFEEFPKSESLKKFDPSDRKFVAVALTHSAKPPITVAIDRGWNTHQEALTEYGVDIEFLCG